MNNSGTAPATVIGSRFINTPLGHKVWEGDEAGGNAANP